tara:strand:+ start:2054 stop:2344 length:291 start_codon:yes stop_codon:yes gene_type:complete
MQRDKLSKIIREEIIEFHLTTEEKKADKTMRCCGGSAGCDTGCGGAPCDTNKEGDWQCYGKIEKPNTQLTPGKDHVIPHPTPGPAGPFLKHKHPHN